MAVYLDEQNRSMQTLRDQFELKMQYVIQDVRALKLLFKRDEVTELDKAELMHLENRLQRVVKEFNQDLSRWDNYTQKSSPLT